LCFWIFQALYPFLPDDHGSSLSRKEWQGRFNGKVAAPAVVLCGPECWLTGVASNKQPNRTKKPKHKGGATNKRHASIVEHL